MVVDQMLDPGPDLLRGIEMLDLQGERDTGRQVCSHHVPIHLAQARRKMVI